MGKAATREAYGKALVELGKENQNIVVLDADLSCSTQTCLFAKAYPERFFNAGVAEQDMMGMAAGLAACGKIAFASTFAIFASGRAWDQVRTSIAYPRLNVKIVATHGGITTGEDGVTHQALEDIGIMRIIPNMTVIVPADSVETKKVIEAAVKAHGPFYIRLSRPATPIIYADENYEYKIGQAVKMCDGNQVTIIACGLMTSMAIQAAQLLKDKGIHARVLNMHTIKPLDKDAVIKAAKETQAIVTAEEHSIIGGLGGAVAEVVAETFPVPVKRVGMVDMFAESGTPQELLEKYNLTPEYIVKAAEEAIKDKR
jgi:transketolase